MRVIEIPISITKKGNIGAEWIVGPRLITFAASGRDQNESFMWFGMKIQSEIA